ncbi:uncharacterized protein LOC105691556 [Athalia rosae]|uniref:uncharacterized protein LOC105691556 n=1 Tax=Athalia rosae TaxID=37344 RepID=UPI002033A7C1|nr:uncharacterized protein LOC105691556 [Athalia rosae]XP_048508000.1 uncharacterized protein LOC105691556 [Athalia rosae]
MTEDKNGWSSDTGGVQAFAIGRRMVREEERRLGMTDEERAWRAQYLKDQILAPHEPTISQVELFRANLNPIRKFYRAPLDKVESLMVKPLGLEAAQVIRYFMGKIPIAIALTYATFYYFKYNQNDWTRKGGWRVIKSRTPVFPGDPDYPKPSQRVHPNQYAARGFDKSPI